MKVLEDILKEVQQVINNVDESKMDEVVEFITKDKRIFVYGEGRSGLIGKCFAMRLMHIGYTVYVVGETITPSVQAEDVVFLISGSGETSMVLNLLQKSKAKGAHIISVTSREGSTLAKDSSKNIIVPGAVKSDKAQNVKSIQLLSSLFDQSVHIVMDALCLKLSYKDKIDNDIAIKNHSNLE
ncbi:6-phospho-3-hexuloisomerase [Clostridium felsineum]|uniref:3-hexulose-6-phosphate isomerase n=1 Tax=Clostridium felsineum TaxID=36839 RepID=A0A1S8MCE9_9CLOT|nr:6-phospho-3-hexuloisomerase [Clostridium felsineum]URZ04963.1 3-hexulose-6-phosphate isomerase [Clostridium felsineum]URZ10004.1 3-hexulose-6-phosphate isomerase [Clostridium felsineum]